MKVVPLDPPDPPWVMDAISQAWGGEPLISQSGAHRVTDLRGLGAYEGETPLGFLHYRIDGGELEVVTLFALGKGKGVGRALLEETGKVAREAGCRRVWLLTTSDNPGAIAFYRRIGMTEGERVPGFSARVREIKPEAHGTYDAVMFELTP